jgi:hypothetical protein
LFNQSQTTLIQYPAGKVGSYSVPNSITNIEPGAFRYCTGLTNVTIGSGVTSIGDQAFSGCTSLTSVTIPNTVTNIGYNAFSYCVNLTSVTIPNSVTSIQWHAFSYCTNLTSVYFQGNAPSVTFAGFSSDNNATAYYLPGTIGWGSTFSGIPTAIWSWPYPLILTSNPGFGMRSNQFGFTVSWATNLSVVIEASTNLNNPKWSPVQTNALNNRVVNFTDSQWMKYPSRFYRLRSQ